MLKDKIVALLAGVDTEVLRESSLIASFKLKNGLGIATKYQLFVKY